MTTREGLESRLFSSESVSMGHPDKVADQISDSVLDSIIRHDPKCRVAVETLVTTGLVVLAGEVTVHNDAAARALEQAEQTARETIRKIGYNDPSTGFDYRSCAVLRAIHGQSADISQGVDHSTDHEQGAGDQGLMFGYACNETQVLMPLPIHLAHHIMAHLAQLRESGEIRWLRPDAKTQVTVEYDGREAVAISGIVLSTQHTDEAIDTKPPHNMTEAAKKLLIEKGIKPVIQRECPRLWNESGIKYWINPTGRFVIGGPHGDCGLTGRKIIVDTYGGRGRHGGGAFSGKDPSKVDRSAAYLGRYIAKNIVASAVAEECEVQLAYAIGVADPVSVLVNTFGTGTVPDTRLQEIVRELFNLQPRGIIESLDLQRPIYFETARHGHFGRELPIFTWEARDKAEEIRSRAERSSTGARRGVQVH